ncbi:hypothetical protein AGMMS50267_15990 [Spirochaetia bacterium]|nr:hypothetical protein AGMMS50267_15990 [Spirochaetia bacterium]
MLERSPYHRFAEFIAPDADRRGILRSLLGELGLPFLPVTIAGNCHFFVGPEPLLRLPVPLCSESRPPQPTNHSPVNLEVVLCAHYDRVAGSPGANDNSAAVFQLIETAVKLRDAQKAGWRVILTDKEELSPGEHIRDQGSYSLARALREAGQGGGEFFIFDACGVGDTLIISTMADYMMKDTDGLEIAKVRRQTKRLRNRALETARKLAMDKVLLAPVPFSDDLGFLGGGITAQTITVLPAKEASDLAGNLRGVPGFTGALIKGELRTPRLLSLIPETWRTLNSGEDRAEHLTPEHYKQVVRFAASLCGG